MLMNKKWSKRIAGVLAAVLIPSLLTAPALAADDGTSFADDFDKSTEVPYSLSWTKAAITLPTGWSYETDTVTGGSIANTDVALKTEILDREDTSGKYVALSNNAPSKDYSLRSRMGKATGVKIGSSPIVFSYEVKLPDLSSVSDKGTATLRGVVSNQNAHKGHAFSINFVPGSAGWNLQEQVSGNPVGMWRPNIGTGASIPYAACNTWHKLDYVFYPANGDTAAAVKYFLDGVEYTANGSGYNVPADGYFGGIAFSLNSGSCHAAFGIDNVSVKTVGAETDGAEFAAVKSGSSKLVMNRHYTMTDNLTASQVKVTRFDTIEDMLNGNGTAVTPADISADSLGVTVTLSGAVSSPEQYRVELYGVKDILGNTNDYVYDFAVVTEYSVRETEAKAYTFDEISDIAQKGDGAGGQTNLVREPYEIAADPDNADNKALKVTAAGANDTSYVFINPGVTTDDAGLEYVDIFYDVRAGFNGAATANIRTLTALTEGYVRSGQNLPWSKIAIEGYKGGKTQVTNYNEASFANANMWTEGNSTTDSPSANAWKTYKIRYYPNENTYKLYSVNKTTGTETEAFAGTKATRPNVAGNNSLGYIQLGNTRGGDVYYDNLRIVKGIGNKNETTSIEGIKFVDSQGTISAESLAPAGTKTIRIYTQLAEKPTVSLTQNGSAQGCSAEFENGVCTVTLTSALAEMTEYVLTVDGTDYTFTTGKGSCVISGLRFEDANGEISAMPSAGTAVKAKFEVVKTDSAADTAVIILAAYRDDALVKIIVSEDMVLSAGDDKTIESAELEVSADYDRISAFLWDGIASMKPIDDVEFFKAN